MVEEIEKAILAIHSTCDQGDEFALLVPEDLNQAELSKHISTLDNDIKIIRGVVDSIVLPRDTSHEVVKSVVSRFLSTQDRIHVMETLREKFSNVLDDKTKPSGAPGRGGKKKAVVDHASNQTTLDTMFKVKSNFPADDVSDQISKLQLLSLFYVAAKPTSPISLYQSVLESAMNDDIVEEMEVIFKMKLTESKDLAATLFRATRSRFQEVADNPMVFGGKTFNEYLRYKKAASWDKIHQDHVLGEVSLVCQVWKLNIAVVWRHEGVWRVFVCIHGGASPILSVLYAKTRILIERDRSTSFNASVVNARGL